MVFNIGVEPYAKESHTRECRFGDFGSRECCPEKFRLEKYCPLPYCQ